MDQKEPPLRRISTVVLLKVSLYGQLKAVGQRSERGRGDPKEELPRLLASSEEDEKLVAFLVPKPNALSGILQLVDQAEKEEVERLATAWADYRMTNIDKVHRFVAEQVDELLQEDPEEAIDSQKCVVNEKNVMRMTHSNFLVRGAAFYNLHRGAATWDPDGGGLFLASSWPLPSLFLASSWPLPDLFLASSWPRPASSWPLLASSWPLLGLFWPLLASSWPLPNLFWPLPSLFWPLPGIFLASSWPLLASSWPLLASSWPLLFLAPSRPLLASSWPPGLFLASSWPLLASFWPLPGLFLASSWPFLASSWPLPGLLLASFWPLSGLFLASSWPFLASSWPLFGLFLDSPKIFKIQGPPETSFSVHKTLRFEQFFAKFWIPGLPSKDGREKEKLWSTAKRLAGTLTGHETRVL
ncbi:hypothetical protein AK812_SmicGene19782 [Symbiodinium microadriaticum]|uniref:Uncharacterized protein n=1 Tax=Symbiodinium microadriaticum TaxID=2951 RepID=A0A1Q9DRP2_SYMMI|nr:hypothetical protein AK812_SmicGene19782 [Symbiodinium microadriaticum]